MPGVREEMSFIKGVWDLMADLLAALLILTLAGVVAVVLSMGSWIKEKGGL